MIFMKEITDHEWQAWSGAEFDGNRKPLIGYFNTNWDGKDWEITVILDKNGIGIHYYRDDVEDEWLNGGPIFQADVSYDAGEYLLQLMDEKHLHYDELIKSPMFVESDERIDIEEQKRNKLIRHIEADMTRIRDSLQGLRTETLEQLNECFINTKNRYNI